MELLTRFLVVATCRVCGKELHSIPGFNNLIDPTLLWNSLPNDDQLQYAINIYILGIYFWYFEH